jgi:hypothetical protein
MTNAALASTQAVSPGFTTSSCADRIAGKHRDGLFHPDA